MNKETFYVSIYRKGTGYMFGDNMITHKSLIEAVKASRDDLDYVGACRLEISVKDLPGAKITELETAMMRHMIPDRKHEGDKNI